jgi:excinuclease ABC subunit A
VLVIEHNLDVVKSADWIVDLGPEGGDRGGMVVAEGTPEQVATVAASHTGMVLAGAMGHLPADDSRTSSAGGMLAGVATAPKRASAATAPKRTSAGSKPKGSRRKNGPDGASSERTGGDGRSARRDGLSPPR